MRKIVGIVMVLLAAAVVGCNGEKKAKKSYGKLTNEAKLAVLNGVSYTKAEADRDMAISLSLSVLKYGEKLTDEQKVRLIANVRNELLKKWVFRRAMLDEAKKRNVELTEEELNEYKKRMVVEFRKSQKDGMRKIRFSDFRIAVGPKNATAFENRVREDALIKKVRNVIRQEFVKPVREADLADYRKRIADINAEASATNAAAWRAAQKAYKSISSGMDYDVVGAKIAEIHEHASYDREWYAPTPKDLEGETNLLARLPKMKVGEVTPPIECDNGIGIIRLNAIITKDSKGKEIEPAYALSRIDFELAETCKEGENDEEARKSIERFKAEAGFKEAMVAIRDGLVVEYPHGEDITKFVSVPKANNKKKGTEK